MLTILQQLKKVQPQRLVLTLRAKPILMTLRRQPFTTSLSQVQLDYQQTLKANEHAKQIFNLSDKPRVSDKTYQVPDYHVSTERLSLKLRVRPEQVPKGEHPLESMAKMTRAQNDIYASLGPNEVLITNLPTITTKEFASSKSVADFLVQNVHKDLQVKDVKFVQSLSTPNLRQRTAYVRVTVGSKRQAQMVKQNLRKTWIHDSLLKVKTMDDAKREVYDNRTVILHGIPKHLRAETVLEHFAKNAGAVVGIELPQENCKLRDLRRAQAERQDSPENIEREIQRRRAIIAVDDGLNAEQNHLSKAESPMQQQSYDTLIQEGRNLENERISGVLRLITRLQAEGVSVLEQKLALLEIKEQAFAVSSVSEQAAIDEKFSDTSLKNSIEANKEQVARSIDYLRKNNEEISEKAFADPLSDLLRLGKEELAVAYDKLILALSDREQAIENRLRKSIEHYGIGERILMQGKDFAKELEDVPNVNERTQGSGKIEEIISVGQQITNVLREKNLDPQTKIFRLLSKTLNPFETKYNFTDSQLKNSTGTNLNPQLKVLNVPDPRIPASLQHIFYEGSEILPKAKPFIDNLIQEQRANMDLPFDELYHRQKKVIQDVIDAEKALKSKLDSLTDPFEQFLIDQSKLTPEQLREAQDVLDRIQSPFNVSQRRRKEALLDEKFRQIQTNNHYGAYKFDYSETADLRQQVKQGLITQKQANQLSQLLDESQDINLGYAFLTFSHADEARLFLLENHNPYYDLDPIEILLKSNLDHSCMDMQYFMAQARNEAKTIEELKAVRESRKRLRDFEKDMDSQLPSRKRLQKFRRFAQSLIDDQKYLTKNSQNFGEMRSKLEQDRFDQKVKDFETANPHIDLTSIYENEKTEAARKSLQKKAYASYKAFHFLKHGVKKGTDLHSDNEKSDLTTAKQRLRDNDPYNFPALDRTVRSVLCSSIDLPQLNDVGDTITTPGRRLNGYTEQEYIESFFGKDMTRRLQTETRIDPLYLEQKNLKEKYPLNSFLKMPGILEKDAQLEALKLQNDPKKFPELLPVDETYAAFLRHRTMTDLIAEKRENEPHSCSDGEEDGSASFRREFKKVWDENLRRNSDKHDKEQGKYYIDTRYLNKALDKLEFALETGKYRDDKDWYELLQDPRTRRVIVEHRLREQHDNELIEYFEKIKGVKEGDANRTPRLNEIVDIEIEKETEAEGVPNTEVSSTPSLSNELKDAKFEPSYDKKDNKKGARDKNKGGKGSKTQKTQKGKDNQSYISTSQFNLGNEIAKAKEDKEPFVIRSTGAASDAPENMTEAEYRVSRMMAQLSPEERTNLQQLYKDQRVQRLEDLQKLAQKKNVDPRILQQLATQKGDDVHMRKVTVDPRQQRVFTEASYIERVLKERGQDPDWIPDEEDRIKYGGTLEHSKLRIEQKERAANKQEIFQEANQRFSGNWFRKYQTQVDKLEESDEFAKTSQKGKMLDSFIAEKERPFDMDDDDDDIYRQYQEMASRSGEIRDEQALNNFTPDGNILKPQVPRFNEYFQAEADGVHPFDKIANSFDQNEIGTAEDADAEQEREKLLYQKEILGRLIGQRLTPSQYELIDGFYRKEELRTKRMLDANNEEFLETRQQVRLMEEAAEKIRRQKVISKEWKEAESHARLATYLQEKQEEAYNSPDPDQYKRDLKKAMHEIKTSLTPETLSEKEYHFDEGVGVSLDEHIKNLKATYPTAKVQTRRDRDGFAIVKLSFQPEYKYNLDDILEADAETIQTRHAETLEALLQATLPSDPQKRLESLDPAQLERSIQALLGLDVTPDLQLSFEDQVKTRKLAMERVNGRFKNDVNGFTQELLALQKQIKLYPASYQVKQDDQDSLSQVLDELFEDRERFRDDIATQLRLKIQKHMYAKKRRVEDFVKPKYNEASAYAKKDASMDNSIASMEKQIGKMSQDKDFDREAFDQLKKELSQRKKLKEDMLTGTLPRFKPYLRV